jgi:hypothetical protein
MSVWKENSAFPWVCRSHRGTHTGIFVKDGIKAFWKPKLIDERE